MTDYFKILPELAKSHPGATLALIGFGGGLFVYKQFEKKELYISRGKTEGRAAAIKEERARIENVGNKASKATLSYAKENLGLLQTGKPIDAYTKSTVRLLLLPKWNLDLDGSQFIIRPPPKKGQSTAWFLTEQKSDEVDAILRDVVFHKNFPAKISADELDQAQRNLKEKIDAAIEDEVNKLFTPDKMKPDGI